MRNIFNGNFKFGHQSQNKIKRLSLQIISQHILSFQHLKLDNFNNILKNNLFFKIRIKFYII